MTKRKTPLRAERLQLTDCADSATRCFRDNDHSGTFKRHRYRLESEPHKPLCRTRSLTESQARVLLPFIRCALHDLTVSQLAAVTPVSFRVQILAPIRFCIYLPLTAPT